MRRVTAVESRVRALVAAKFARPLDEVGLETNFESDLCASAEDLINLQIRIEEAFEVIIVCDDMAAARRVGDLVDLVLEIDPEFQR